MRRRNKGRWRSRVSTGSDLHRFIALGLPVAAVLSLVVPGTRAPAAGAATVPTVPAGTVTLLDAAEGGGWSWFEDERALVDRAGTRLYASVKTSVAAPGSTRVVEMDMATGGRRIIDLGRATPDDHDTAAFWEAPNGEIVTSWSRHSADPLQRQHRRTLDGAWAAQTPVAPSGRLTYNNLYSVDGGATLYNFYRHDGADPSVSVSSDSGNTWTALGRFLRDPADSAGVRPYVRYVSNGVDRIDFITTQGHPENTVSAVYHGYVQGGRVFRSDGTDLGALGTAIDVTRLTLVFAPPAATEDSWTVDVSQDPVTGRPAAVFTRSITYQDNRYYYARWTGTAWDVDEMAHAGRGLYPAQPNYTGLAALDPTHPDRVVISTSADPVTGAPLISGTDGKLHYELFAGTRDALGAFAWAPLTANSTADNLRPVWTRSPSGASALLWLRGTYTSYVDFRLALVGVVQRADGTAVVPGPAVEEATLGAGSPAVGDFDLAAVTDDIFMYRTDRASQLFHFDTRPGMTRTTVPPTPTGRQPVVGDFDGDGSTDVFWYGPGAAPEVLWKQYASSFLAQPPTSQVGGSAYAPVVGDFDGDGDDDIYWYVPGSGRDFLWRTAGGRFTTVASPAVNGAYSPVVGDYDGDGDDDIFWYAPGPGADYVWRATSLGHFTSTKRTSNGVGYVAAVGDYTGDGDDDIYWYRPTGRDSLWSGSGGRLPTIGTSRDMGLAPDGTGYLPEGGSFDGVGPDDLVWCTASGQGQLWRSVAGPVAGPNVPLAM